VSPKPKRNEIIVSFTQININTAQINMRIAIFTLTAILLDPSLALPTKTQQDIRASLITKDNVADYLEAQRQQRVLDSVPEPFVVTTSLNIRDNNRKSRTWFDDKDGAIVIEGQRMPDDKSDAVTYRNGRFINNVFVPNNAAVPEEVTVAHRQPKSFDFDDFYQGRRPLMPDNMAMESRNDHGVFVEPPEEFKQSRDYKYHAGSTNSGNPVYYVVEEPDSLHSDRSPYDFEPADTHTSLSSQVADYTQSGYNSQHTNSGDFVIKEHSYTMCPGCPTFSIPVPIPKASLGGLDSKVNYQHARNQTFLEKIGNRIVNGFQNVQRTVLNVFDPILETGGNFLGIQDDQNQIEEKIDRPEAGSSKTNKYMPLAIASMAAMALGGMALFASAVPATKYLSQQSRAIKDSTSTLEQLQKSITKYECSNPPCVSK